ncbi:hypothetical protein [Bacillus suaedaesalsae]|uniref:YfhD family protein n=1 Tax=Bacillus suaedaesalsae TaxID=2810349 RepID=A0ABS2DHW0_9BACI|nr:hypothetical protein [Bacillus suaedaesalsae]MBM6618029.1 hypothetical protein [Bacillus suaedaesalsae]
MSKKETNSTPNISGSFQMIEEERREDLQKVKNQHSMDEESLYYARQFMED